MGFQQVVLANHAIAVVHQIDQEVENLWLEGDQLTAASQLAALDVKRLVTKTELQAVPPRRSDPALLAKFSKPKGFLKKNQAFRKVFGGYPRHARRPIANLMIGDDWHISLDSRTIVLAVREREVKQLF